MRTLIATFTVMTACLIGGCQSDDGKTTTHTKTEMKSSDTKNMSADACSHCAGVQKANANGTCPKCGMKL
ncbi:MAG TPA: hypothetical protein VGN72_07980 [Tepidisphaeraceae bacterium]|jgi:uncharacterized paraquat-inducible protein A|nr:hypothetical protein [Tepidisphaeraceae bacterium]